MKIEEALHQISEIRGHLARAETFRGTKAVPVAATGIVALAAAAAQPLVVADPALAPLAFLGYWIAVATVAALIGAAELARAYVRSRTSQERATIRAVVAQLAPPIAGGAVVTCAAISADPALVRWLPGLWAVFTGLALFAARPLLPKKTGIVALLYVAAGSFVLLGRRGDAALLPWVMGATFGGGQILAALVFWSDVERDPGQADRRRSSPQHAKERHADDEDDR